MAFAVKGCAGGALPALVVGEIVGTPVSYEAAAETSFCTPGGATTAKAIVAELLQASGKTAEVGAWLDTVFNSRHMSAETEKVLAQSASMLRAMLNIGVRNNALQKPAYAVADADAALQAVVAKIADAATAAGGFLAGRQPGLVDAVVAAALYEPLALLQPPSVVAPSKPVYASWFTETTSTPAFEHALAVTRLATGGKTRIGGQVDLRPQHARVSVLADAAIDRNAGYKKAESQRAKEDAAKAAAAEAAAAPAPAPAAATVAATATQPESNKTLPEKPVAERIALTESKLTELGIAFSTHRHAAAPDVTSLMTALEGIAGGRCKNLVLKAKKEKAPGDSMLWLVVALAETKVDLVDLAKKIGYGKTQLRMAATELMLEHLGVAPGNATPFALMNDTALQINVALDKSLTSQAALLFHPLTNEASTSVKPEDLLKFISATGHKVEIVDFTATA